MAQKLNMHLGKFGLAVMISGLSILYYDAYRINQIFPVNYRFYEHPEIHIPIIGIIIAFVGTSVFIVNFIKGRKVI